MPHLHPENPQFRSSAEAAAHRHLAQQLPDDAHLLANVGFTDSQGEREIDLLVVWPGQGVAVIEVKGGVVSIEDGEWVQTGAGHHRLHRSPVVQAQDAKHALERWTHGRLSNRIGRMAHMVALPFTKEPDGWDVPDAPRDLMIFGDDLDNVTDNIRTALDPSGRPVRFPAIDATAAGYLVKQLRATHKAQLHHAELAEQVEQASNQYTREQEHVLSLLRFQNRAQIIGGAGSGKTHLAMLKARQLTRAGKRTALLCYSRGLAAHLAGWAKNVPDDEHPAFVGLFHDLPVLWGAETEEEFTDGDTSLPKAQEYYERHLPRRLAELAPGRPEEDRFDAIVVDEAQDFADVWWDGLEACLRDPQESVLYVFADEHQSVFDREGTAPVTLNPFPLDENVRNTATIARTFAPLTEYRQIPRLEPGAPVVFVQCDTADAVSVADDQIDPLLDHWEPGDIALLTTGSRHPMQKETIEWSGHDGYWEEFFAGEDVFYGHVLNFKGLERRVVVLALNGFHDGERARHLLYVGLSRATMQLVVVGDEKLLREVGGDEVADLVCGR